jgi:hypothetical protein
MSAVESDIGVPCLKRQEILGKSAQLALPIPADSGGLTLVIKMGALVNRPAVPYQVVEVLANGQKTADWEVADMADFSALIPGEVISNQTSKWGCAYLKAVRKVA